MSWFDFLFQFFGAKEPDMIPDATAVADRLIRQLEGFRAAPYQDTAGNWTIGIGTVLIDGEHVTADTPPITMERATELLNAELAGVIVAVDGMAPPDATSHERAALYSFTYNEGEHAFETSTLARLWQSGNSAGAAGEFAKWNIAGGQVCQGLINRRRLERAVFLGLFTP